MIRVLAVLTVSDDAFIVCTSNAFAILGLWALYFLPVGLLDRFRYLSRARSVPEIPSPVSLAVLVTVPAASVVLSIRRPGPGGAALLADRGEDGAGPDRQRDDDCPWSGPGRPVGRARAVCADCPDAVRAGPRRSTIYRNAASGGPCAMRWVMTWGRGR